MDSDSFIGKIGSLDEISGKMSIVSEFKESAKGHCRLFIGERMGKKFILKALKEKYRNDPTFTLMIRKEFEIGFSLSHPGIVRTLSLETIEELGECIVEEYVPGNSLEEVLSKGTLGEKDVNRILDGLLDAVEYIHSRQIVHNDLKPSNIIVSEFDGMPRILDFGFADTPGYTSLKFEGGTSRYMAPERRVPSLKSSPASDVWSLGVILSQLADFAGKDKPRLKKLAAQCLRPVDERIPTVVGMKELLAAPGKNSRTLVLAICLTIIPAIFLIGMLLYSDSSGEGRDEETVKTKIENNDTVRSEVIQPAPVSGDKVLSTRAPEGAVLSETGKHNMVNNDKKNTENIEKPVADKGLDYYLRESKKYAITLAERRIAAFKKEEGNKSLTVEGMLSSQTAYYRIMNEIKSYVASLDITSDDEKRNITKEAQAAADSVVRRHRRALP